MPTYDYACSACKHRVEYFQSMSEKPKKTCPKCGARKLVRQIGGGAGILFRGSGFYQTDYRSPSYKQDAAADTNKPSEAKGESKPSGDTPKSPGADAKPKAK